MADRRKDSKNRVLREGEYQRSNGSYEYKWRDKKGERHSIYAKTLEQLRGKELDAIRDAIDGISQKERSLTLNDLYDRWVNVKRGLKPVTFNKYKHDYARYIKPSLGGMVLSEIKQSDVRAFYNQLKEELHFAVGTVGTIHRILHQILELGVDDELIRKNPATKALKDFKNEAGTQNRNSKALTYEEQTLFEEFLKRSRQYSRWRPLFTVLLWTGLRVGEVTALRWCDLDFENNLIRIDHALSYTGDEKLQNNKSVISSPKTENGIREVPMLPIVKDAFLKERKMQELLGIKCNVVIDGYTDFVFLTRSGGPKHVWGINDALDNIVAACNKEEKEKWAEDGSPEDAPPVLLPPISCHWLRHTFATRCCEANVNPKALQSILGHADYQTTMGIYAEATLKLKQNELVHLNDYFKTEGGCKSVPRKGLNEAYDQG